MMLENCKTQFAGATYKQMPGSGTNDRTGYILDTPDIVESLNLYPQPVEDVLTVELTSSFAGDMKYELSSVDGQVVKTGKLSWNGGRQSQLNVSQLKSGSYILTLHSQDKVRSVFIMKK